MKNKIIHIDMAVCSAWGRRLPKHIFKTQYASKNGHHNCLNCGMTKKEIRAEEGSNIKDIIESRVIDLNCGLDNPVYLTNKDLKEGNYKVLI